MKKEDKTEKNSQKNKSEWTFKEFVFYIILIFIIVLPIRVFIAQPFIVSGESMEPTFSTGDYLIIDQLSYRLENPKRGDIMVFRLAQENNRYLIKRLIGLPGETIKIKNEK